MRGESTRRVPSVVFAAICAAIAGCAVHGPAATSASAGASPPGWPQSAYELRLQDQGMAASSQSRLADAALDWELLTVLRPDVPVYRERWVEIERRIDVAVSDRLPRAAERAQRGDLDGATQVYLSVLALQPTNEPAADALRALERERNRRDYLGKSSSVTLTRRANSEAEMSVEVGSRAGVASRSGSRRRVERPTVAAAAVTAGMAPGRVAP